MVNLQRPDHILTWGFKKTFFLTAHYLLMALAPLSSSLSSSLSLSDSQPVIKMIMSPVSNEASAVTSAVTLGSPRHTAGRRKHCRISLRLNRLSVLQTPRTHSTLRVCVCVWMNGDLKPTGTSAHGWDLRFNRTTSFPKWWLIHSQQKNRNYDVFSLGIAVSVLNEGYSLSMCATSS